MSARITTSGSAVNQRGITAKRAIAAFNITTADLATTGDALFLCEIPAEMIITSIKLINDDLDAHGTPTHAFDIGLYETTRNAGPLDSIAVADTTIVDVDMFVDGSIELQAANVNPTEILGTGSGSVTGVDAFKSVRDLASASPGDVPFSYLLGLKTTVNAATAAAGNVTIIVEMVQA